MNTEAFIRDAASRGWSKTQTRQALGLCTQKFWDILRVMPPLDWAGKGYTLGNKRGNEARKVTMAVNRAAAKARAARRLQSLYTWGERTGTIEELAEFSPASARTIRRRLAAGMEIEKAFSMRPRYVGAR